MWLESRSSLTSGQRRRPSVVGEYPTLSVSLRCQGMAPNAQRIIALLERTLTDPEPTKALSILTELRHELDELERSHVGRALQSGSSFADVARPLRISRQAAHRRYRDLASPPPQRPTLAPEARAALIRARQEAARHGSISINSTHLLLAIADQYGV